MTEPALVTLPGQSSVADTREAILDAAERIFGQKGYDATSVREIVKTASANLGLISYYFGSKERLFIAAIERRYDLLFRRIETSIAGASADDSEALVRAFIAPILHCASREGEGWRNYLMLLARGMNAYRERDLHSALRNLANIADLLRRPLAASLGLATPDEIAIPSYLLEAAIIYITQDRGLLDVRSGGRHGVDRLDAILDEMVRFFAAGFVAFRAPPASTAETVGAAS